MTAVALRPLSIGEMLDTSFQLYRRHFGALATIVLVCNTLPLALNVYVESAGGFAAHPFLALSGGLLGFVLNAVATGATVFVVSEGYLGRVVTAGDALNRATPFVARLILASIMYSFLVLIGFLLFIVPGIVVAVGLALYAPALVVEAVPRAGAALSRSWQLTKGARWRLMGVFIALALLLALPMMAMAFLVGAAAAVAGLGDTEGSAGVAALAAAFAGLVQLLWYPMFNCAMTVAYYDQRVRREGFDLELLAAGLRAA
ncbi:MAG TPA: hypothetical protein VFU46_05955 [Gemmatimonadales bacterium]|nr:hypothetical protein [Gemmatimonadales bacterium]